jgi:hypothetical protein
MTQTFDAIVIGGLLHPVGNPQLPENRMLRVTIEPIPDDASIEIGVDPLAGLARDSGIPDLAENFDDYRFGRRQL